MKLLASALLAGAATAAVAPQQQVLQAPKQVSEQIVEQVSEAVSSPLHQFKDALKSLSAEAQAVWDEVAMMFPEEMSKASFFSSPKKHTRRPDHEWDHIVRGQAVQDIWVTNADGEQEREVGGQLDTYDLRVKKVDPSSLGVDPNVTQYSGYLDDKENDKHLFYCKLTILNAFGLGLTEHRVLRIPQRSKE